METEPDGLLPAMDKYSLLHQPSSPEEVRTLTHSALELSRTVSCVPVESVVKTRPLMLALSRRFRYTVVVAVDAAETDWLKGAGKEKKSDAAHNTAAAVRLF